MKPNIRTFDEYGVPILSDADIEAIAEQILYKYNPISITQPQKCPLLIIIDKFQQHHGLKLQTTYLGEVDGKKIRGKTILSTGTIILDTDIWNDEPMLLFTGAHELGHWMLHRIKPIHQSEVKEEIEDNDSHLTIGDRKTLHTPRDWIEHHANIFAASLLLPKLAVIRALSNVQKELGVSRNLGKIFLDGQESNINLFQDLTSHLQAIFGTSRISLRIRLSVLNLLVIRKRKDFTSIGEILKSI